MFIVACMDANRGLSKDGKLLMNSPVDMSHFRELTIGKKVIMGRKTLDSLPAGKPLHGRTNYVLTRNIDYNMDGIHVFHDATELLRVVGTGDDVAVIGGADIYSQFIDFCDTMYLTVILDICNADTFFPCMKPCWKCVPADFSQTIYISKDRKPFRMFKLVRE